ncbi:MAG: transcription termination factor Rho [Solirubrobacterales bacterium]|jgi:hypothetical protein|nr:transcription termination factor Rho [Solirubrobacterales bacterium]
MNKAELESKHLAELHALAADADVPRYRMLPRAELIEKLASGKPAQESERPRRERPDRPERPPRRRRERPARKEGAPAERRPERAAREPATPKPPAPESPPAERAGEPAPAPAADAAARPKRRRRRRRFGRKSKGLRVQDFLLPPPGRQALVYGESREVCTSLLREIASEVGGASDGPDPIALLVDPSPEELADWKREAPDAELVVAAQARHASDALAQASRRAESGEDVILLVDSLSRLEDADTAKAIFDGGLAVKANGSLTVVAALERSS